MNISFTADPEQFDLRLRDGDAEYEGRLEIYYGGHWGTICGLGWSDHEGNVACKQLGFYGVFEVQDARHFGEGILLKVLSVIDPWSKKETLRKKRKIPVNHNKNIFFLKNEVLIRFTENAS